MTDRTLIRVVVAGLLAFLVIAFTAAFAVRGV